MHYSKVVQGQGAARRCPAGATKEEQRRERSKSGNKVGIQGRDIHNLFVTRTGLTVRMYSVYPSNLGSWMGDSCMRYRPILDETVTTKSIIASLTTAATLSMAKTVRKTRQRTKAQMADRKHEPETSINFFSPLETTSPS